MTRVLLADDHPMIASALEMLLRGTDYQLVGRARSGKEALAQIDEVKPDLVLLDVNMPDGSGIDVLRKLRKNGEERPIILLTAGLDDPQLIAADDLEPNGVVLKTSDPALLLECMDQVSAARRWVDPEIVDRTKAAKQRAVVASAADPARARAGRAGSAGAAQPRHRRAGSGSPKAR